MHFVQTITFVTSIIPGQINTFSTDYVIRAFEYMRYPKNVTSLRYDFCAFVIRPIHASVTGYRYMTHLYGLAVQAVFYGDAVECLTATREIRVRSPVRVRSEDIFLHLSHLAPNVKSSYRPRAVIPRICYFKHSLWPGSSGTKPNLVGEMSQGIGI